ncbi:Arm DNA-binding domain-containing protein [Labilibaculum sp.]|uniref:Arm DNA-binding domain-containing protein n=1 Tax=Labilibaculum sp. TaxID=2060723 RepID=UPI0038B28FE4
MRQTTSILFFARKTTQLKNGESPIFVRITVDGQRLDISLKKSIDLDLLHLLVQWLRPKFLYLNYGKTL